MLTINPRIATFPGWETDPYYGANEAYTVVQPDLQNPFSSPILPPSTKVHITDISQPLESSLSPADSPHLVTPCAEPTSSVSISTSIPPTGDSQTLPTSAKSPTPRPKTPRVYRRGHDRKRPAGHIPRPPNAFILYRSDFLRNKHKVIPQDVDQQNLSILAGKLWRHLDAETREYWYNLSRQGEVSHTVKHPNYRYQPIKKDPEEEVQKRRQQKTKEEKKQFCDELIETYLPEAIKKPVVESPAPRKRKSRAKPKAESKPRKRTSRLSSSFSSFPAVDPSTVVPVDVSANEIPQASEPQSAVCGSSATNAIPQAPLAVAEPTAVNELYARYNRDKAAGRCTTSEMFLAQYNDQSSFLPKTHSQFLPSSQIQVEYSSSMVPDYFSGDVFQNLVLPPAAVSGTVVHSYPSHQVDVSVAQSGAGDWADVVQTSAVQNTTPVSGSDAFNNVFHGTSPVNFPLTIASANPYPDVQLIEPQFISSDDLSQINLNLDGLGFFLFNNVDSAPSVDQFNDHEGSFGAAAYGFNDNDGGLNIPAGVDPVTNQDVGSGDFNGVYNNDVGHISSADYAIVDQADNQYHVATINTEPQPIATINPSEISINPNDLGSTFDHQITGTAQDNFVYDAPKFYNLDHQNSLGFVNTETGYNPDCGYNNFTNFNNVAHVGSPTYIPTTTHSEAPGFDTNINHTEGYGAYNHNPYINSPVGIPVMVPVENNALGLDFSGQESIPTAPNHGYHHHHHNSETNPNFIMYYDNPVLSGVLVPDKPPPYMYQSALDVPTNANANGYENWTGNINYQGAVSAADASQWMSALAGIGNVN